MNHDIINPSGDFTETDERRRIIHDLVRFLVEIHNKWFEIGVLLGIPVREVEIIDKDQFSCEDKIQKLIEVGIANTRHVENYKSTRFI